MHEILQKIEAVYPEAVAWRRDFHQHPELSNEETRTAGIIAKLLRSFGVDEVKDGLGYSKTGVVGLVKGTKGEGKCIAIRADIDALRVTEGPECPFASKNEGVMHACGHDGHAAMLLATAKVLVEMKDQFAGSVKLIFQPAEECAPRGGARPLVEDGVLENPHVDAIIAAHLYSTDVPGKVLLYKGQFTTSFDLYDLEFIGKAGHGSQPHTANDAILAACQYVVLMQQVVSRRIDPLKTEVLTAGTIEGGTAVNIIAGNAKVGMVARAYDPEVRAVAKAQVYDIAAGVEKISGCKVEVTHTEGYSSVKNDAELIDIMEKACNRVLGPQSTEYMDGPLSFSEDFGRFMDATGIPGAQVLIGAGHEWDEIHALHHPKFSWKEESMKTGIAAFVAMSLDYLA